MLDAEASIRAIQFEQMTRGMLTCQEHHRVAPGILMLIAQGDHRGKNGLGITLDPKFEFLGEGRTIYQENIEAENFIDQYLYPERCS